MNAEKFRAELQRAGISATEFHKLANLRDFGINSRRCRGIASGRYSCPDDIAGLLTRLADKLEAMQDRDFEQYIKTRCYPQDGVTT